IATLATDTLPKDWNVFPHPSSTQRIGDDFVREQASCVLQVPSAVVKGDYNLLINPIHPDFSQIRVLGWEDFPFDKRLFKL
ncbi:MAG: RES family NAD+ phosphorylase, partial [Bacteroidota bacterium]